MAKNKNDIYILRKQRKPNRTFLVFLGILGFVAVIVPFFGSNLRYMTGTFFKTIFVNVGQICLTIGGALFVINLLKIFFRKFSVKSMMFSCFLLWVGAFLTGIPFELLGIAIGGTQPPQGYHYY
ncbi:MAG: hypothetical protein ACTSP8_02525 [Promethearchaeota archaeon]